jgi:hypothetical protein
MLWFSTYHGGWSCRLWINSKTSDAIQLNSGVSQGILSYFWDLFDALIFCQRWCVLNKCHKTWNMHTSFNVLHLVVCACGKFDNETYTKFTSLKNFSTNHQYLHYDEDEVWGSIGQPYNLNSKKWKRLSLYSRLVNLKSIQMSRFKLYATVLSACYR